MDPDNRFLGMRPEQLSVELTAIESRLRVLHKDRSGKPRELSESEQREFDEAIVERDAVEAAIRAHAGIRRSFRRGQAMETAYRGLDREAAVVEDDPLRAGAD